MLSIETPDRIAVPPHENLRRTVDSLLRDLVLDDPYGLELAAVQVYGDLDECVRKVVRCMHALPRRWCAARGSICIASSNSRSAAQRHEFP